MTGTWRALHDSTTLCVPQDISINVGILLGYIVDRLVNLGIASHDTRWRVAMALAASMPLAYGALSGWLPDTPRWLMMVGRRAEAVAVLKQTSGSDPEAVEMEISAIESTLRRRKPLSWRGSVRRKL